MKKIFLAFTVVLLVFMAYSCSKDHDAPTFSTYAGAEKATDVVASYNQAEDVFTISWTMEDTEDVTDYYVVVSDSMNFNGTQFSRPVNSLATTYTMDADFITVHEDSTDSFSAIRYFAVQAVYVVETGDGSQYFIGPRSADSDSALYISQ